MADPPEAQPPGLAKAALALAGIPALAFFALAFATRVDAPTLDDFDAILRFLLRQERSDGVPWLAGFLEPHVDHRMVLTRALAWAQLVLGGRVDFAWLSFFGNALAAGMFALLVSRRGDRATALGVLGVIAASLLWFQPQAYDMVHWPTASIASYAVLAFAALAFVCVAHEGPKALVGAWLCCAAATLCQGNGSVLWPSVLGVLLLRGRLREAAGFAVIALPPIALYAATYRGHSNGAAQLLDPGRWGEIGVHGLQLLGAVAGPFGPAAATALGVGLAAGCIGLGVLGARRVDVRVLGLGLVALGTVAGNAVLRAGLGAEYALSQPRYRISSVLVLLVLQLGAIDLLRERRHARAVALAMCVAALGFSLSSYLAYAPAVKERSESIARGTARWQLTRVGLSHPEPERAGEILRRAIETGVYSIPAEALARLLDGPVAISLPATPSEGFRGRIRRVVADSDFVLVEGQVMRSDAMPAEVFVVLEGGSRPQAVSSRSRAFVGSEGQGGVGFRSVFARPSKDAGDALGLLVVAGDDRVFARTPHSISRATPASEGETPSP